MGRRRSRDDKECEWVLDEVAGRRKEREGGGECPRGMKLSTLETGTDDCGERRVVKSAPIK